jgi:hypothetical protein
VSALTIRGPTAPSQADTIRALVHGFERAGWHLREVDVDLVAGRLVIRIHRFDGRWLHLSARADGGATLERWHRQQKPYRYRGVQHDGFEDTFLGRIRAEGIRSGLRSLSNYIADNPCPGRAALSVGDVRALLAPLLSGGSAS